MAQEFKKGMILVDGHGNRLDVVETIEDTECAERIQHHLRIFLGIHQHALAVLQIDNVEELVRHDKAVAGAEAVLDVLREVDSHLKLGKCVLARLLRSFGLFSNKSCVVICAFLHFSVVVRVFCQFVTAILKVHLGDFAEEVAGGQLAKLMGCGAFFGILARALRKLKLE